MVKKSEKRGPYKGDYELLSSNEEKFLKFGKDKNLLKSHSNVPQINTRIKRLFKKLDEKRLKKLIDQLLMLIYESPQKEKLVTALASSLIYYMKGSEAYSAYLLFLFEEKYQELKQERDRKIRHIIEQAEPFEHSELERIVYSAFHEVITRFLNFICKKQRTKELFNQLIISMSKSKGKSTKVGSSRSDFLFLTKLVKKGILIREKGTYKLTEFGRAVATIYLVKNPISSTA